jgi:hypothetical protein
MAFETDLGTDSNKMFFYVGEVIFVLIFTVRRDMILGMFFYVGEVIFVLIFTVRRD